MTLRIDRTLAERKCRMALKSIRKGYDGGHTAQGGLALLLRDKLFGAAGSSRSGLITLRGTARKGARRTPQG